MFQKLSFVLLSPVLQSSDQVPSFIIPQNKPMSVLVHHLKAQLTSEIIVVSVKTKDMGIFVMKRPSIWREFYSSLLREKLAVIKNILTGNRWPFCSQMKGAV